MMQSESNLADVKPLVWILKESAHLFDLVSTNDEQQNLKTLEGRYTSLGATGA